MKEMNNSIIGVAAATGDLGSQVCVQLIATGHKVLAFARSPESKIDLISGLDLVTKVRNINERVVRTSLDELLAGTRLVHWCAPLTALEDITALPAETTIVLHDSVMSRSVVAKARLHERFPDSKVAIVHCLMNTERTVVVADGHDDGTASEHFISLGMNVKHLSVGEHDLLMAHSQAPLAILCKLLMDDLESHHKDGLLTNSGQALRRALIDRSAHWTPATLEAILDNPQLPKLISAMERTILTDKV